MMPVLYVVDTTTEGLITTAEVAPKMTGQGLTLMEVCAYDRPYGEF